MYPGRHNSSSRGDDGDNRITRNDHHLDPAKLVKNATRIHRRQFCIVGHDIADLVQRLLVLAPRVDLPDAALIEGIPACRCGPRRGCSRIVHADIPQLRIISMPSSLSRAFVQTGSHTTSMRTSWTPGSCSRRARISSMMNSVAGQPIAVKVSLT